jgi:SAM-dependent methyltransferase
LGRQPNHTRDQQRSIALEQLAPLMRIEHVSFFSLQKGSAAAQLGRIPAEINLTDLGPQLTDFAETAALLANLDLLISVDTAAAHLAAALGKPRLDSAYAHSRLALAAEPRGQPLVFYRALVPATHGRRLVQRHRSRGGGTGMHCSQQMIAIVDSQPCNCKICGAPSPLFGVVDFHKSCLEAQGKRLQLSGKPVYYRRCTVCEFLFAEAFDDWSVDAFLKHIYNEDYSVVDPHYAAVRATCNAKVVAETFQSSQDNLSILDYGGGNGVLARALTEAGFRATTYDPFTVFSARPEGPFDLITCFEVLEHSPFPDRTVSDMSRLLANEGIILCSTLTQPSNLDELGLRWWYAGPRNGHVSLYSRRALTILFQKHGLGLVSLSDLVHLAFRKLPAFASTHLAGASPS